MVGTRWPLVRAGLATVGVRLPAVAVPLLLVAVRLFLVAACLFLVAACLLLVAARLLLVRVRWAVISAGSPRNCGRVSLMSVPTYTSPPNATWSGQPVEFAAIVTIRFGQLAAGVCRVPRVRCPLLIDRRRTATSLGRRVTCAVIDVLAGRLVAVHAKGARHAGAGRHVVSVCPTANGRTSPTPASWRRGDGAREPAVQREGAVIRRLYYRMGHR